VEAEGVRLELAEATRLALAEEGPRERDPLADAEEPDRLALGDPLTLDPLADADRLALDERLALTDPLDLPAEADALLTDLSEPPLPPEVDEQLLDGWDTVTRTRRSA
jgi:hypothetical protein